MVTRVSTAVMAALAAFAIVPFARAIPPVPPTSTQGASRTDWPGEDFPLPLAVRTAQDLAVKALAEREYLLFNLLAGGKLAFDAGNFAVAATKWEALLRLPGLDADIDRAIRPLAIEARLRAGGQPSLPVPASPLSGKPRAASAGNGGALAGVASRPSVSSVSGVVSGGGALGPGGTVLWMKRIGAPTPRVTPGRPKVVSQRDKTFIPRVLVVPVGTRVDFRNEDEIFHNVFSLSQPNDFDAGLYRQGASYSQIFRKPGPVQILCNIHASMIAYVLVVDTPYFAQADSSGAFTIKNVPPGEYELETWHEASASPWKQKLTVDSDGVRGLAVKVSGDKAAPRTLPDKSGKPRQAHLGY